MAGERGRPGGGRPAAERLDDRASAWTNAPPSNSALLSGMLDSPADYALFVTDLRGTVRVWSKGAAAIFGHADAAAVGKLAWWDLCAPGQDGPGGQEDGPWRAPLDGAAAAGSWAGIVTGLRKDGGRGPLRASVSPLPGKERGRAGFLIMCVDVAEDVRRTQDLQDALFMARRRFADCVVPMCVTDLLGVITEVNDALVEFSGRRREELVGAQMADFVTQPGRAVAAFAQTLREGRATKMEFEVRRPDGSTLGAQVSGSLLTDRDGNPRHVLVVNSDMTEEIRVREQLRKERAYYRGLVEAAVDGMAVVDRDGFITDVTRQVCQISGFGRDELVGSAFAEWFSDAAAAGRIIGRALSGAEVDEAELRLLTSAQSERTVLIRCQALEAPSEPGRSLIVAIRDITERVQLRDQLAHERAYTRRILNGTTSGIVISDLGHRVTDANAAACELTGRGRDDLLGREMWDLFTDPHKVTEVLDRALLMGRANSADLRLAAGEHPVMALVTVLRDEAGEVEGLLSSLVDITESERLEQQLVAAEAYARTIIEASPVALIGVGDDGLITDTNRAGEELTGYPRERLTGRRAAGIFADEQRARDFFDETYRRRRISDYEMELVPAGRPPVPVAVYGGVVLDPRVDESHLLLAVRDISAEKAVREGLHLYIQSLYRATTDALVLIDLHGRITDVNRQMEVITGRSRQELTGALFEECFTDPRHGHEFIDSVLRKGQIADVELTVRRSDGAETVLWYNAGTFSDTTGKLQGIFASARDVTERNRLQRLQAQMLSRAKELDRAKSEFVSRVSHELRSPLTSVMGYLEVLQEDGRPALTSQHRQMLDVMYRNAQRLLSLIEDLLLLSRIESGVVALQYEDVDLADLIASVHESFLPEIQRRGLASRVDVASGTTLEADPHQLERALTNLVSNAVKFTPEGGQVSISCRQPGDELVIEVSDTGMGVPKEEQPQLFSRFFRSSLSEERETQGTGLGLYIVKNVIDAHGGSVEVESEPGAGATFTVRLPVRRPGRRR